VSRPVRTGAGSAGPGYPGEMPGPRSLVLSLGVLLGVGGLAGCGSQHPPHVVLFVIDTLRADRLGTYGYDRPTSPVIDALAEQTALYERAYAPAPWTLPSVVSLHTSVFPCEHGVVLDGQRLGPGLPTLAERLYQAGYATASFYANPYAGTTSGLDRGFARHELRGQTGAGPVEAWLEQRAGDRPFFLYIHNTEPHDPYAPPPAAKAALAAAARVEGATQERANGLLRRLRRLTRVDWSEGQEPGSTDNSSEQSAVMEELAGMAPAVEALYDAEVRHADARLGEVVRLLRRHGLWEDTLFILTSDHGEEFGEHGGWQHDQSVYEELLHVPLLVRWPDGTGAGRRIETPVSLLSVVPTVLEAVGRAAGSPSPRSLRAALEAPSAERAGSGAVGLRVNRKKYYAPFARTRGDVNVALRQGAWKGIWNVEPDTFELYHLGSDPGEQRDRSAGEPERVRAWRASAARWLEACRARAEDTEAAPPLDAAGRERLRALGYLD